MSNRSREGILFLRLSEPQKQAAHGCCGCPIIGSVQVQVGGGSEEPSLVESVPDHGRMLGLDDL